MSVGRSGNIYKLKGYNILQGYTLSSIDSYIKAWRYTR